MGGQGRGQWNDGCGLTILLLLALPVLLCWAARRG